MKGHKEHHMRKSGGKAGYADSPEKSMPKEENYNGSENNVEKEAEKKKRGGHVKGEGPKKHRLDRPGRKRGGGVGADMHPLSSASKVKNAVDHTATEGDAEEGP